MSELDVFRAILRALVYVGSIAAGGGVLFAIGFPYATKSVHASLARQIAFGCALLLCVEPLRYVAFQLAIAQGDWTAAFGPDLRWMGLQTPIGQAAALRMAAAALIALAWPRATIMSLGAVVALVGSFLLEGHTASVETRSAVLSAALFIHLAAVHWWIGSLHPLIKLTRMGDAPLLIATVERFGRVAMWIVAALAIAGGYALITLTNWSLRLDSAYQWRFGMKLLAVAALLSIAAWNKLRLTPLFRTDFDQGAARLRASIRIEMAVAGLVLAATAWAVNTGPAE